MIRFTANNKFQFSSFVALFSLHLFELSSAASITGKFSKVGDDYICKAIGQSYGINDTILKIFGKHLKAKVNGSTVSFKNDHVTVFNASYLRNDIQRIPTKIFLIFLNLREMWMESTNLKIIDENSFESCDKLSTLVFGYDNIRSIGADVFKPCNNLEVLEFRQNIIDSIDDGAFNGLSKLKVLLLRGNKFEFITPELLRPLVALTELTISENPIATIHSDTFTNMRSLRILILNHNELTNLSSALFEAKPELESVDLSNNSISKIDAKLVTIWPNNAALDLRMNECVDKKFDDLKNNYKDLDQCFEVDEDLLKVLELEKPEDSDMVELEKQDDSDHSEDSKNCTGMFKCAAKSSSESSSGSLEMTFGKNSTSTVAESLETTTDEIMMITNVTTTSPTPEAPQITNATSTSRPTTEAVNIFATGGDDSKPHDEDSGSDEKMASSEEETTSTTENKTRKSFNESNDGVNEKGNETTTEGVVVASTLDGSVKLTTSTQAVNFLTEARNQTQTKSPIVEEEAEASTFQTFQTKFPLQSSSTDSSITSMTSKPYLHPYEQATCRFYVDAHGDYVCVITNAERTLKHLIINHIDGYTNSNVSVVFLLDSNLLNIPRVFFNEFRHLNSLSCKNCGIKSMDSELFEICGNLKHVDLSHNLIRRVDADCLKMCPMMETVDLTDNPVEKIESKIFECNPKLTITLGELKIASIL